MKMVLDQLKLSLEPELLQKAADKLADANHVVILAEGGFGHDREGCIRYFSQACNTVPHC